MGAIKAENKLNGGINTDTTPERLENSKLLDACNVDIFGEGEHTKLQNIKGTTNILKYLPDNTDLDTLNVLGVFNAELQCDYNGDGIYEEINKALVIYSYDATNGSQIFAVDLIHGASIKFYPNAQSSASLDFPPEGTVSASFTKERGRPEIYWDDNRNELRKLILQYSTAAGFLMPTLTDIGVRRRVGGIAPTFTGYGTDGFTTSGTYQVAYRFYNRIKNSSSKWSLFTNPIPISNEAGCTLYIPLGDGAPIGQIVSKTILLSITFEGAAYTNYDSIQLAVVKNIDGLTIPSNTVYITLPSEDWYNTPSAIEYSDAISFIAPYPVENVVTEDAAIKCAKTQVIKENVLDRGNITYNDFTNDRGSVTYETAHTIKSNVCYNTGLYTVNKKGHFREEVYAYAIAYYDKFFNFGLVEPLDFAKVYKMNPVRTLTVTTFGTPDAYNQLTATVSSTANLECGDYVRYLNKAYQVCEVNSATSMLLKYRPDLTTTSASADLEVLYGQEGNQTPSWAWKFPARSDNKFAIIDNLTPQALGLHIKGIVNHPTWAKGMVVVRQDRIKNIIFQTPHIPTVAVQGVPTQGKGPITFDATDYYNRAKFDISKADYKGQLDYITPKCFGLGHAMNIPNVYLEWKDIDGDHNYVSFYSVYTRQGKSFVANPGTITPVLGGSYNLVPQYGAETPRAIFAVPPDYILNNGGQPTLNYALTGNEKIDVVDAVALTRQVLNNESPYVDIANLYKVIANTSYFYSPPGYVLRDANAKEYFVKLNTFDSDIDNVHVAKDYDQVLASTPRTIDNYIFDSDNYKNINIFGGVEQLSVQQGGSNAIPADTNSFTNVCSNQRGKLLLTDNPLLDFTKVVSDKIFGAGVNYANLFPAIDPSDYSANMYDVADKIDTLGGVGTDHLPIFFIGDAPILNNFTEPDKVNSGMYVLNITKGLPDNRYNKISTNWKFTGAYHYFTDDEIANNTPIDIDVWGGDCFLTDYQVKVNNNTPRVSDVFETISDEAKDYILNNDSNYFTFDLSTKTGSFQNNVEIVEMIIESEVNTGYIKLNERVENGKPTTYYSKPFLYQYNGSYSINNDLKSFVTKPLDAINNFNYQARFIWSKTRLYQAESSAFIDTEGFDFFPVNNKKDLDEQYGGITSFVDFGSYLLHIVQEHKIRYEPISRSIAETGSNKEIVLGDTTYIGKGGDYLKFDYGSQHIRTVKYFNGTCFMFDAMRRSLISFSPSDYKVLSDQDVNKYFYNNYQNANLIKEIGLLGVINDTQEKQEFWLLKDVHGTTGKTAIIFNLKSNNFKSRIDTGDDKILNGVSNGESMYLLSGQSLFTAYTNAKRGYLLDRYRASTFKFCVNDYPSYTKTFNVMNLEMQGNFVMNKDTAFAQAFTKSGNIPTVSSDLLAYNSASGQIAPLQKKNYQWWINRIREVGTKFKLRGDYMIVEFTINNDTPDREVSIASIVTECELNYPIR